MGKAHNTHDVTFRNGVNVAPLNGKPLFEEPIPQEAIEAPPQGEPEPETE